MSEAPTPPDDEDAIDLLRVLRQQVEALGRAGLARLPFDPDRIRALKQTRPSSATPRPSAAIVPPVAPVLPRPTVEAPVPAPAWKAPASPVPSAARPRPAVSGSLFGDAPLGGGGPPMPPEERLKVLGEMAAIVAGCVKCEELAATRTQTVFADGKPTARLMFIGEAPGADEDRTGVPFVGRAGQLLTDMITKGMGLDRQDVYIANILKCRPPGNRDPKPEEAANCVGYLERQIEIVRPEFLCLLGRVSAQRLLETALPMNRLRGRWHEYRGIRTAVTYHPAALLRNPAWKKETWEDLKMLMRAMGLKRPDTGPGPDRSNATGPHE